MHKLLLHKLFWPVGGPMQDGGPTKQHLVENACILLSTLGCVCCAGVRLWHKLAVGYSQPRLVTYWRLSSPVAACSARASVLCALWLRLVEEAQAEDTYLAGDTNRRRIHLHSRQAHSSSSSSLDLASC